MAMITDVTGSTAVRFRCLLLVGWAWLAFAVATSEAQDALAALQTATKLTATESARDAAVPADADHGLLFIDGEYVSPPYEVAAAGEHVRVNGKDISALLTSFQKGKNREESLDRARAGWAARRLQRALDQRDVVVLFAGQSVKASRLTSFAAKQALAEQMLSARDGVMADDFNGILPEGADDTVWRDWLASYQPPAELADRLQQYEQMANAVEIANQTRNDAVQRLNQLAYPLTTLGMVLSVLSIGHLLRSPLPSSEEIDRSPQAVSVVTRSLMLVMALSVLDLVWTILAHQAGQMRELNPLGSQLIDSPLALLAFKAAITCAAAGLLFRLRHYSRAQTGAWWACLICTLLTLRWLVLNSLFIA